MTRPDFDERHFIEEVATLLEDQGMPRIAGRIVGRLLIADPPAQTRQELEEVLAASAGSVSTMTRLLLQAGLIERIHVPGERRARYQLVADAFASIWEQGSYRAAAFRQIAARGLELLDGVDPGSPERERLESLHDLSEFFERELPPLISRWKQEQQARRAERLSGRASAGRRSAGRSGS